MNVARYGQEQSKNILADPHTLLKMRSSFIHQRDIHGSVLARRSLARHTSEFILERTWEVIIRAILALPSQKVFAKCILDSFYEQEPY